MSVGRERPKVMSPRRLTYEQKFERFVIQNLEKGIYQWENPEDEEKPRFDLSMVDNENSVNIKAIQMREKSYAEKLRKVEEMMMNQTSHAVPGHDEIRAQKESEEEKIDCPQEHIDAIR